MFLLRETGAFPKELLTFQGGLGNDGSTKQKQMIEDKNPTPITASEEDLLFISEQASVHFSSDECT